MPVSLKDRLDRYLKSLPIKRASWILMAIYEKLERDEKGWGEIDRMFLKSFSTIDA